jgi:hypothetical protein
LAKNGPVFFGKGPGCLPLQDVESFDPLCGKLQGNALFPVQASPGDFHIPARNPQSLRSGFPSVIFSGRLKERSITLYSDLLEDIPNRSRHIRETRFSPAA